MATIFTAEQLDKMAQELAQLEPPAKPLSGETALLRLKPALLQMRDKGFTINGTVEALKPYGLISNRSTIQRVLGTPRSPEKPAKRPRKTSPATTSSGAAASGPAAASNDAGAAFETQSAVNGNVHGDLTKAA